MYDIIQAGPLHISPYIYNEVKTPAAISIQYNQILNITKTQVKSLPQRGEYTYKLRKYVKVPLYDKKVRGVLLKNEGDKGRNKDFLKKMKHQPYVKYQYL